MPRPTGCPEEAGGLGSRRSGPLGWAAAATLLPAARALAYVALPVGLWLGRRLGDLAWLALSGRRRIARENLERAFAGERPRAELARIGRRSFEHLGMNLVELCRLCFRDPGREIARVALIGCEHVDAVLREGRGALIVSAHYGNWELLAARTVQAGYATSVLVRTQDHPALEALAARMRGRGGFGLIDKRRGLRGALAALRRGEVVGMLLDQNAARPEAVFVPFFGTPAATSRGLALIARRSGAPILPAFIRRAGRGTHVMEIGPPLPATPDVTALMTLVNATIEAAIRREPEQWLWVHRRWRTRPPAGAA